MAPVSARYERTAADEATRGSLIKLAAEVLSRLVTLATTVLLARGLGPVDAGRFGVLSVYALLLAELGELGLQNLASRALVAGTLALRALIRARLLASLLVAIVTAAVVPIAPFLSAAGSWVGSSVGAPPTGASLDGVSLGLLIVWLALSGWGEFLGVALRCRGARQHEAVLLLVLRTGALVLVPGALSLGGGLRGACSALALSPIPALVLGAWLLRRTKAASAPSPPAARVLRESSPLAVHGGLLLLSPRVELLVLSWYALGAPVVGLFWNALNVYWFLSMIPSAVAAGAMPALTRELGREAVADRFPAADGGSAPAGDRAPRGAVRSRTAFSLALLAAPAAVGLALVAPGVVELLLGPPTPVENLAQTGGLGVGYTAAQQQVTAEALRLLAAALPALFLNPLLAATLIAAGRAAALPWLTAGRVALAFVLAYVLVPRLGVSGAAAGLVAAEWLLLGLAHAVCRRAGVAVGVAGPIGWALLACVPMAMVVAPLRGSLPLALAAGVCCWLASVCALAWLAPARARQLTDNIRYP